MQILMRSLSQSIDQSLSTARELRLDTIENLLALASLELSTRMEIIAREPPRPAQRRS